ncbi:MAG: HAD-IIB family hydrolase [Bdellovibrionales bacterium]|nr:HAD-IIB family hydrolase [Bdellovibrionales bacterium]
MKNLSEFIDNKKIKIVFCDIDDTLTHNGKLPAEPYSALWTLAQNNISVIPVTGRPAGWCEMIARFWPVHSVIGENGAFYFSYQQKKMKRFWCYDQKTRNEYHDKLKKIEAQILKEVPGSATSSDQFCRLFDLAIDFKEDVEPLDTPSIQKIVDIFSDHGAQAKVSSIHVNGWFGNHNKLTTTKKFLMDEFQLNFDQAQEKICFIGDSPNDEPMFEAFIHSFAVSNIKDFSKQLIHPPSYVTPSPGGFGFVEFTQSLLKNL